MGCLECCSLAAQGYHIRSRSKGGVGKEHRNLHGEGKAICGTLGSLSEQEWRQEEPLGVSL